LRVTETFFNSAWNCLLLVKNILKTQSITYATPFSNTVPQTASNKLASVKSGTHIFHPERFDCAKWEVILRQMFFYGQKKYPQNTTQEQTNEGDNQKE
jgi:hypothetical protein